MERVLVPDTPDLSFNDGDETGTSSMLSSILGRSSVEPSFSLGTESPQKAMMLPDIPEQNSQIEVEGSVSQSPAAPSSLRSSAALMRGYFGPGKYADANSSSAYHSSNNVVDVATAKKIFETIDKMQQPNIAASRGSIESLARGSASGLNQVLTALHEHDRTIRSLQTALKDIDMVAAERASQMGLASKSNFELADYSKSVLELETGVKDFQRRRTASKSIFSAPSDGVSKEWVQNEVEIQLESFRKALSLDNLKQIISQEVKRCLNPGNKSSGIKNMVEASLSRKESMISNTPQINADEIERKMMQMISDERPSVVQAAREVIESSVVDKFTSQVQELQSTFRRKAKDEAEHLVSQFQKRLDLMEKKLDKVTHTDTSRGVEIVTAIAHLDEHLACTTKEIDGIKEFKDQAQAQIRAIDERQAEICDLANSHISSDEVNDRFVKLEQQLAHLLQVSETKHEVSSDTISLAQEREEILSNEIATLKEENTAFKESMANMQEVLKTLSDQKNIKEHGELSIQMSQHLSILESVEQVSARLSELEGHVAKSRKVNDESLANLKGLVENGVDDFDFQIRTVGVSVRMLEERISQSSINPRSFVPWEFLDVSLNQIRAQIEHLDYEVANNAANTDFNINDLKLGMTDKFETNLSKVVDSLRTKFVSKDDIETKLNSLDIFTKVEDLQLKMKDMSVTLENQKAEANFAVKEIISRDVLEKMADIKSQLADRSFFREPSSIPHPSVTMDPGPFVEDRLRTVESSIRRLNSVQEIEMPQLDSRFKQIEEQVSSLKKDSVSLKVAEVEAKLNLLGCSMQELSEFKDITQRQLHPMLKAQSQIEVEVPNLMARIETLETKGSTQNHKLSLTVQQVEAQIHEFGTSMLELKGLKELSEAEKIPVVSQPPANDPQLESRVKFLEAKIRIPRDDTVLLKVQEIENRLYELGTSVRDLEPLKDRISSQYQPANDIPSKDNSKLESRIQVLETRLVSQKDASDSLEVSEIEKRLHQLGSSVQELECFKEESEKKSRIAHSVQEAALSELPELNSRITFLEMQYKHTSALAQEFEELKRMTQNAGNVNSEKVSELAKRMEHLEIHLGKETDNLIIQKIEHLEHKLHLYAKSMQELEVFKNVGQTQLLSSQPSALETLMPIVQSLEAQIIKNKQDLDAKLMKLKTEEKTLGIDSTQIATLRQNVDDLATEIASLKKVEKTVSAIEGKLFASSEAQGALIREAIFKMNQERQHTRVDAISVIETVRDTITATHNSEMSDLSRQLALLSNSVTESRFAASKFDSHQVRIQSLEEQLAETKQKTTDRFAKLKPVEETVRSLLSKIERVSELEGLVLKLQKSLGSQSPATPEESRKNPELIQSQRDLNQCKDEISKSFASRFDKQNMMLSDLKREMSTVMEELEEVVKVRSELDDQKLLISDMNEQVKKAQTTFKSLSTFKDSVSEFAVMTTKVSALESEMVLSCQREATLSNEFHISLSQQKEEIKKFVNTKIESQNMIITALKQALSEIQEKMADEQSQGTTGSSVVTELQSRFATLEDTFTKIRDKTVVSLETEKTSDVITELGTECTELTKKIGALDKLVLDIEARTRSIKAVNDGSSNSLDAIGSFRVDVLAAAITEMKKVLDSDINPQLQEKDADIKNLYSRIAAVSEVREAEMNGNESEPSSLTPRTVVATLPEIRQEINLALNRHDKKSESLITTLIKDSLDIKLTEVDVKLEQKVNNDVLEELVKHLATREELKKLAKKKSGVTAVDIQTIESQLDKKIAGLNLSPESFGSNLNENMSPESKDLTDLAKKVKRDLKIYLQQNMEQLEAKIFKKMESQPSGVLAVDDNKPTRGQDAKARNELKTWVKGYTLKLLESRSKEIDEQMQKKQADLVEYVKRELKNVSGSKASEDLDDESSTVSQQGDELNFVARRLTREFDEKLFLLCSDLSACKESLSTHFAQPFYRCAQWIWKSGQLKMGSALPWNIQSLNTDPYNFVWEEDQVNIRVQDAGLYEITFAFFTKTKPSVQIVVNGESVLSSINSPSYVVHHSSGYVMDGHGRMEEGTVTGLSLIDFLALPAKSTLSLHYHGVKKGAALGHGFLGLKKL